MQDKEIHLTKNRNFHRLRIRSASMYPILRIGDTIIVKKILPDKVTKGDIVTYYAKDRSLKITHRVTKVKRAIEGPIFYTKGDNVPNEDLYPIVEDMLIGKVVAVIRGSKMIALATKAERRRALTSDRVGLSKRLMAQLSGHKREFFLVLFFSLLVSLVSSVIPYLSKPMIDKGYAGRDLNTILILGAIGATAFILNITLSSFSQLISNR